MPNVTKQTIGVLAGLLTLFALTLLPAMAAGIPDRIQTILDRGSDRYRQGDIARAVEIWGSAAALSEKETAPEARVEALLLQAKGFQALGHHDRALTVLGTATSVVDHTRNPAQKASFYARLGDLYLSMGRTDEAMAFLEDGEDVATVAENRRSLAGVLLNTGVAHAAQGDYADAMAAWKECRYLLQQMTTGPSAIESRVRINMARLSVRLGDPSAAMASIRNAMAANQERPDGFEKGRDMISLALSAMEARRIWPGAADQMDSLASDALQRADALASNLEDPELISQARGYRGRLYEMRGRTKEALRLTLSALFHAQQSGLSPEIRYRWHWQSGRLNENRGAIDAAIRSYRLAVETLTPIRQELITGYRERRDFFQEYIRPVYLDLSRLLLQKADAASNPSHRESLLQEGQDTMELLKTVELQEYFQDPCVSALDTTIQPEEMAADTAVIYPIPFPRNLAILLITRDAMDLFTVPVASSDLDRTVRRFRRRLQNSRGEGFREDGRTLYDWLVRPMEPALARRSIHTLVIAPDGVLRLIPFSALYDGERFLIQRYAVGTVPAITLTAAEPAGEKTGGVLLKGLSEARQGFASLPSVKQELKTLHELMGGTVLLDEGFTLQNLTRAFDEADYGIVHMATHGVFGGSAEDTFLLTHDDKLTMDRLEAIIDRTRRRGNRVDLLTLSACQTALGDEWAAFGLAGIAVKAGVSSAVATLWFADDEAAFDIMTAFYRQLHQEKKPKAEALRLAQVRMIGDDRFHHPAFWAPFLLIGNWR